MQKLESDFTQMRAEILAGVPLTQLKPLFVDCGRIMTDESYVPAQVRLRIWSQRYLKGLI